VTDISKGPQGQEVHRISCFEILVIIYQSTWCNIPKDLNRQQHHWDSVDPAFTGTHSQRVLANVTTGCYW